MAQDRWDPPGTGALARLDQIARTRAARVLTRIPRERRGAFERHRRRNPAVRLGASPALRWLRGGAIQVAGGAGLGLRLSLEHLPIAHVQAFGLVRGGVEIGVQEALRRLVGEGDVVYDIGANIGFFTLLGARLAGPAGHVYAFEPDPTGAAAVRDHATLNGFANVTVFEKAAGEAWGHETLLAVDDSSWSHLESRGQHPRTQVAVTVEVVAIDVLVEAGEILPPRLVKLDVEGSELDVLRGMSATLARHGPAIVCELHETNAAFVELMEGYGYAVENLDGATPVVDAGPNVHTLALPRAQGDSLPRR